MYYSDEIIEEVRSRNDIVDVISGYVQLKRQGNNHFGICPFHNEKSPSFSVNQRGQFFHCFGCGKGGNVFTFISEYENFSFPEAVKFLADKSGVELPEVEMTPEMQKNQSIRQRLYEINKEAARFFYYQLRGKDGQIGIEYFKKRELSEDIMKQFGLGYSLKYTDALYKYLRSKDYDDEILRKSGLFSFEERYGFQDKFINRVMFPIFDIQGKVVAFGGRVLGDAKPKYLNSPETDIFHKSRTVYGLNFARTSRKDQIIMCEGYMDVIAMHQAGFTQAAASLGTAFTPEQANLIKRYSTNILLAYDSDEAGTTSALRNILILQDAGLSCKVINLEPYKDPDEFIKNLGSEEFQKRIDDAENGFMFEIRQLRKKYPKDDPDDRTQFQKGIAEKLCRFTETLERDNYLEAVCRKYEISSAGMRELVTKTAAKGVVQKTIPLKSGKKDKDTAQDGIKKSQKCMLTYIVNEPELYLTSSDFTDDLYKRVSAKMFEEIETDSFNPAAIISSFPDVEDQRLVAEIFNTNIDAIGNGEEKSHAIKDLLIAIKDNAIMEYQVDHAGEAEAIMKVIKDKQSLEKLRKTNLNI